MTAPGKSDLELFAEAVGVGGQVGLEAGVVAARPVRHGLSVMWRYVEYTDASIERTLSPVK